MKEEIIKIIVGIIVLIILIVVCTVSYLMIADIETNILPNKNTYTCNIEIEKYMKRNVFILTPKNVQKTNMVILYIHGGAYMAEISDYHWSFLEKIINNTGATVILPDYPLTPKYDYKDVFNMMEPLYQEIVSKVDKENFIVMGDSAGGGLALALEEKITLENSEYVLPKKTVLISPWLDVRLENEEIEKVQKFDKQLNRESLKMAGIAYAGEDGINSYLVNPIDGDLSNLENITIFTGTYDILNPDVKVLENKAVSQGISIDIREYEKASHIWTINNYKEEAELVEKGFSDLIEVLQN